MAAFANVADLEARWRFLSEDEAARATVLLDDASLFLTGLVTVNESDNRQAEVLKVITCNLVMRRMAPDDDMFGVTQQSMTAVGFSQQQIFANPTGDFYLTKMEKIQLGIKGDGKYRSVLASTVFDETSSND